MLQVHGYTTHDQLQLVFKKQISAHS